MKIENLINAVGAAVQDAHNMIELNYLGRFFEDYFEREETQHENASKITYKPKTIEISISDSGGSKTISAPLAALVQHTNMNIDYVKINLDINVTDEDENGLQVALQAPKEKTEGNNNAQSGQLELMFKNRSTPEGIARIETYLNNIL